MIILDIFRFNYTTLCFPIHLPGFLFIFPINLPGFLLIWFAHFLSGLCFFLLKSLQPCQLLFLLKQSLFLFAIEIVFLYICIQVIQLQIYQLSCLRLIVSLFFKIYLFIYFWLCWVFVAVCGLSLVAARGGYSSLWCAGFSLRWLLLLRRRAPGARASIAVAPKL